MSPPDGAVAAVAALPDGVRAVLHAAATVVAERAKQPVHPDEVVADPQGVHQTLMLLERSAGLRAAVARRSPPAAPDTAGDDVIDGAELSAGLTARSDDEAARAAAGVRALLDDHRRAARRAARGAARAARTPAAERDEQRQVQRLAEVRAARDAARAQRDQALAEAAALRDDVAEITDEVSATIARAEAAEAQLAAARAAAADPVQAAAALAAALTPGTSSALRDSRGVGPGEPTRVDPGRGPTGPALDVDRLAAAVRSAGLPADLAPTAATWLPALLAAFADPPRPTVQLSERDLCVDVLGGGAEIGGSCVLVTAGGSRILVDAGTRPGATPAGPPRIAEALAARLDGIVITHAHNDHAGWVPTILTQQPDVPVIATEATASLLATMWFDSAKVMARRRSDDGDIGPLPPYGRDDVRHTLSRLQTAPFGRRRRLGELEIELFPAGHIVGAAGVVVHAGGQRVVVSGDVSRPGQRTVGGIDVPDAAKGANLLLLESTYAGSGRLPPRHVAATDLVRTVATITGAGGRVLVPAFALGRAQEVALTLAEALPDVDVLIDGLARDVSAVYEQYAGPDGAAMKIFGSRVRAVPPRGTRDAIASLKSGVVIATSGMLTAGPAVSWAKAILPDPTSGLMVVGYQDEDSPGARLLALAENGGGEFELLAPDGTPTSVPVQAQVSSYKLGAHASADELATITQEVGAGAVMLVHGEARGQATFAERLALRGQATVPAGGWSPA
ncbi:MBL fold metallo-hydrolase [Geodermatophilus sabuli]|uniref:RNA processing exonuclease, beta-lactamase fold, Cft2 family n=1 Tax=Geodermatophilus sabuli TaxID=1564158 RepID=A0A285ECF9_9ACTN|nr:MBL fold metallo-hydrolase [Geodermatophilus sabuli]MBB3084184.1 Cft2 family RNA processing exonuclease [Geodermatophilus sabuli]SNX96543.1 RNA processing exonuclease, beta-lactamase fold, Cft2 family [Geodermatophilus sabuli]